jgi:hypothetical protein
LKRPHLFFILFGILIWAGCSKNQDLPTISKNAGSAYEKTFNELSLGVLFDFDFRVPEADQRWVTLWVDRYHKGEMESEPLTQLSYGNSPQEVEEGNLGFGMINPNSEDTMIFLYGPGVKSIPERMEEEFNQDLVTAWDYAIGEDEVELQLGETKILAAYRGTTGNSMRVIDFQDEDSINYLIDHYETVLLMKIKVEEKEPDF